MGVATSSLANPTRTKALMVRLAPHLVEAICELTRALKDKTHAQTEISGLLFGKSQDGMLTIEALKTFKDSTGPRSELARRERMEKAFTAASALAHEDPEFAAYKMLGWFSLRGGGGLINSDVEFHNRHFRNQEEIALIVWREGDTQLTAELYAAVESGKLSAEDYRWSSVRLSTELRHVSQPVDLVMRVRMNDDLYLRTYGFSDGQERKDEWKRLADSAKRTILSLLPGRGQSNLYPEDLPLPPITGSAKRSFESRTLFRGAEEFAPPQPPPPPAPARSVSTTPAAAPTTTAPGAPTPPVVARTAQQPLPNQSRETSVLPEALVQEVNRAPRPKATQEVSGLPMVIQKRKPKPKGSAWQLPTAIVFVLFSALTFAAFSLENSEGGGTNKLSQIMKVLFPGSDLELRADGRGDRLLLTWNRRNPAVAASSGAVLGITDGSKYLERKLDPLQVAEGSVLYKPATGDVTFQLRVVGTNQSIASGKLRVLDATTSATGDTQSILDLSSPPAAAPSSTSGLNPPPPAESTLPLPPPEETYTNRRNNPVNEIKAPALVPTHAPAKPSPEKVTPPQSSPQQAIQQPQPQPTQTAVQQPPPVVRPPVIAARQPSTSTPQTSNTAINGWDPNLPETKPATPQQQPPPDSKTVDFIGPKVLLQVMPSTRNLTPDMISEVTRVEVEVRIDTAGHVRSAKLGNPNVKALLGAAALAAAKQWTFQPATLRGQHVESDHTIVFEFRPEGQ
jgi:TonB family protein